ncbi:hypothetical protein [Nesterenkonia pannonica]|uniref:hypothetical protein n=1 Tax=Nesterenkonia pannonica TaxID=1548602 RepID=UPI002164597E|nr:hypothetical protein [Nesterenkonia pannonica]
MNTPTISDELSWALDDGDHDDELRNRAHHEAEDQLSTALDHLKTSIHMHREMAYDEAALRLEDMQCVISEVLTTIGQLYEHQTRNGERP